MGQKKLADPSTFKVNARRVWKQFPHSSQEMNHLVGSPLLRTYPQLKVKVKQPDMELRVEIRENETYLYYEVIPGAGVSDWYEWEGHAASLGESTVL